jgi:DNA-binding NtrC family response regulator
MLENEKKFKILIVDDQKDILEILSFHFANQGFEVNNTNQAQEAMKMLTKDHDYDAIVCDIVMPDISGVQVLKHLRSFDEKTQLYVISGYNDYSTEELKGMGANAVFKKPFDIDLLVKKLKSLLNDIV